MSYHQPLLIQKTDFAIFPTRSPERLAGDQGNHRTFCKFILNRQIPNNLEPDMDTLIAFFVLADVMLAVTLLVVTMAHMDRRYAARVRAEHNRKSVLRGHQHDEDRY